MNKTEILDIIGKQAVLPLFYNEDSETSINVLRALYEAGIRTVEYTNRGEQALKNFSAMRRVCETDLVGMQIGVGTIKTAEAAEAFSAEGADYLISPGLIEEVAEYADKQNLLWVPGCMTPSEIIRAENLGATFVKLFPGNLLGSSFLTAIKPLFPKLRFMPTGGVALTQDNLNAWFKAGVFAVGMGSNLITKEILEGHQYDVLTKSVIEALNLVQSSKL